MKAKGSRHSEQGMTLIETITALTIFLVVLGFMVPMFANQRLSTIRNDIKSGAVDVSQQVMDQLRLVDSSTLPTSGAYNSLPSGQSLASLSPMGSTKVYTATITYCQNSSYCNANARDITVQINYNGQTVYTVETVYTKFQ